MLFAQRETIADQPQLGHPLVETLHHLLRRSLSEIGEHASSQIEILRPAIVRIDQRDVPQLCALVKVGDAGRSQLHQRLRERIYPPSVYQRSNKFIQRLNEIEILVDIV